MISYVLGVQKWVIFWSFCRKTISIKNDPFWGQKWRLNGISRHPLFSQNWRFLKKLRFSFKRDLPAIFNFLPIFDPFLNHPFNVKTMHFLTFYNLYQFSPLFLVIFHQKWPIFWSFYRFFDTLFLHTFLESFWTNNLDKMHTIHV